MTFLEIVNEVLFDRFGENRRASVQRYVNARYGRVWASEAWTFKRIVVPTSVTAGVGSVTLASLNLQRVEAIYRASSSVYYDLPSTRPEDFLTWATTNGGVSEGFTVYGDSIQLERSPSSTTTFHVLGEQRFSPLVSNGDEPLIPPEFHMMLVHGAASEALRMENDPTWEGFEQDYQAYLQDMRMSYLTSVRNYGDVFPTWIPRGF